MAWNPFGVMFELSASGSSVTRTSATQYTVKISAAWETYYSGAQTNYGMTASSGGGSANLNTFGKYASSGSGSFTGTYSISGNGSQTKTITVTFRNYNNDNGDSATTSVTFNVNVPAWTSYTVSYNANGGSGAPSSQTKWKDQTLTLSSTKPTRTGYTFKGWALSKSEADSGTWYYQAGSSCGKNENLTLYATWTEHKLTINYYSNYATSAFADALTSVGSDKNVKVWTGEVYYDNDYSTYGLANYSNSTGSVYMTRTGYTATGNWGTTTNGGTLINENTGYSTGQAIAKALGKDLSSGDASINLYAQWTENKLTVNYYSNYADYGTLKGELLNVSASTNIKVDTQHFSYSVWYGSALANVQNTSHLYLSRTGYTPTGYWGTSINGGALVDEEANYSTGQALAEALGKDLSSGNASVNVYPQWKINAYTIGYDSNGGYGSMDVQLVNWQETFVLLDNKFKREGYKFVGWNVQRETDRKWYVGEQGWTTEEDITANGYEKKLYANQDELIFDLSWIKGETGVIHQYTLYAIWEISGVVYIDNGTTFEPYLVYIDNGTEWGLYVAYIDDGVSWHIIS